MLEESLLKQVQNNSRYTAVTDFLITQGIAWHLNTWSAARYIGVMGNSNDVTEESIKTRSLKRVS